MYLYNNNVKLDNKDCYETDVVNDGGRKKNVFRKWHLKSQQKKLEQNNLILLITKHKWSRLHSFPYNYKKKKEVELAIRKKSASIYFYVIISQLKLSWKLSIFAHP